MPQQLLIILTLDNQIITKIGGQKLLLHAGLMP